MSATGRFSVSIRGLIICVRRIALVACLPGFLLFSCCMSSLYGDYVYTCNRLQLNGLEVWEWAVKRRIFDLFSELPGWVWFPPELSLNLHIYVSFFRGASAIVSPLPCCGIVICSKRPLIIPDRRYRLPE